MLESASTITVQEITGAYLLHSPPRRYPRFEFGKAESERVPGVGPGHQAGQPFFDAANEHVLMEDSIIAFLVLAVVILVVSAICCIKRIVTCHLFG